jgi:hypothetical protein
MAHLADAEVEFKVTSLSEMAARPVSMFSYDLAAGHRVLWGGTSEDLLAGMDLIVIPRTSRSRRRRDSS